MNAVHADVVILVDHYIRRYADEQKKGRLTLTDDALEYMLRYPWPRSRPPAHVVTHHTQSNSRQPDIIHDDVEYARAGNLALLWNHHPHVSRRSVHPITGHTSTRFEIVAPYTLALDFDDETQQRIDFRPVLEGEVFGPLQVLQVFNAVELDPTFGTIQWPNGADFDPETLHDWPKSRDEFVTMAKRWATGSNPAPDQRANTRMEPTRR